MSVIRRRDRNVLIGGRMYALTALTAIRPGREQTLRDRLVAFRSARPSPFARMPSTHFARLVILDRLTFEGPPQDQPAVAYQHLLFSATFDGVDSAARDDYLEGMCETMPAEADSIWNLCLGAPEPVSANPARFASWLTGHQVETRAFFAHAPNAAVADVRAACELRTRVSDFAIRTQYLTPSEFRREFSKAFPA